LDAIIARINSPYYTSPLALQDDFLQMFTNAMTYNDENSEVYFDAVEMRNMCVNTLKINLQNGQILVTDADRSAAAAEILAPAPTMQKKKRMSGVGKKRKVQSDYESDESEEEVDVEEEVVMRGRYDGELPDIGY
jgi:hypothetical protein